MGLGGMLPVERNWLPQGGDLLGRRLISIGSATRMTISAAGTDLRALFEPRSVALIGASADPSSISARPLRLLRQHGYLGALYPVNPKYQELSGLKVYPSIGGVPEPVDLALVVVPASAVAGVLAECAAAGVGCAVVITSGFAESSGGGAAGPKLQQDIAELV